MSRNAPPSELSQALVDLKPFFKRAAGFSVVTSLLVLAPTVYMLEVYDRVVNSRSHMTLAMLTVMVLGAVALMEVLEWVRAEVLHEASLDLDKRLSARVFNVIFALRTAMYAECRYYPPMAGNDRRSSGCVSCRAPEAV